MKKIHYSNEIYTDCFGGDERYKIEQKWKGIKAQLKAKLAAQGILEGGAGIRLIIDNKKNLMKDIITLKKSCLIKAIGKKEVKDLTNEEMEFIINKIETDFPIYVERNITHNMNFRRELETANILLSDVLPKIEQEKVNLIIEIKGEFRRIKKEKELLKKVLKISDLIARPSKFKDGVGHGFELTWNPIKSEYLKYFHIQMSNDRKTWKDYKKLRDAQKYEDWINIHGEERFIDEEGEEYTQCLPSGQTFFFRVRGLDINGKPITNWSNIAKGTVTKYPINSTAKKIKSFYVDKKRIDELKKIKSSSYDTIKLVRLCEELNISYSNECVFSTAMLLRAIIDHVPPIFNQADFKKVVNNYSWSRSNKKNITRLEDCLRNISDFSIHSQIRDKEALPSMTQIDFRNDLDVLLQEIVRLLKIKK